jgi:hypothetical protein
VVLEVLVAAKMRGERAFSIEHKGVEMRKEGEKKGDLRDVVPVESDEVGLGGTVVGEVLKREEWMSESAKAL